MRVERTGPDGISDRLCTFHFVARSTSIKQWSNHTDQSSMKTNSESVPACQNAKAFRRSGSRSIQFRRAGDKLCWSETNHSAWHAAVRGFPAAEFACTTRTCRSFNKHAVHQFNRWSLPCYPDRVWPTSHRSPLDLLQVPFFPLCKREEPATLVSNQTVSMTAGTNLSQSVRSAFSTSRSDFIHVSFSSFEPDSRIRSQKRQNGEFELPHGAMHVASPVTPRRASRSHEQSDALATTAPSICSICDNNATRDRRDLEGQSSRPARSDHCPTHLQLWICPCSWVDSRTPALRRSEWLFLSLWVFLEALGVCRLSGLPPSRPGQYRGSSRRRHPVENLESWRRQLDLPSRRAEPCRQ